MKTIHNELVQALTETICQTNGITLNDTLDLIIQGDPEELSQEAFACICDFKEKLNRFIINQIHISELMEHAVSSALFEIFKSFPLKYREEHIHLTGALTAEFIYPRLKVLLDGPDKEIYKQKIIEVYGASAWPIQSVQDVDRLIRLSEGEGFMTYLKILYLPKLIFVSRQAHKEGAYHIADELYHKYNVGFVRLKFSLSRSTQSASEQIPGIDDLTSEDVILGLYDGFKEFQNKFPDFDFVLSPSFRKEAHHFDSTKYSSRKAHFDDQVNDIIKLVTQYPQLAKHVTDVDTVGDESNLYRKEHFNELQEGFRKLQYRGIKIRSHHGETWKTLRKGIQAVDNSMNIWHIDTLEHGLSLGINPNKYFHRLYQEVTHRNRKGDAITSKDPVYEELISLDWGKHKAVLQKLLDGQPLNAGEQLAFMKSKFHTAREVEHYQHDVLNRLIQKDVALVSLPSSNNKLTGRFEDYKDHPFSWWEKKNVQLGVGTDNYITLNTNFIQELLIILFTDCQNLKITKLLMVASGETRRPYISHLLWKMQKALPAD